MMMDDGAAAIRIIENRWIPLPDGRRLAARLWLPATADVQPVPAVLEYIPYRKRGGTRGRDAPMHGFFAAQGFAAIRVDMRGSGDSEGLLADEYLRQEQDDGVAVIAWIAAQSWCSGAVGLMGKSWGGFNALQIAARRPAALRAVITVCSTDDRFADDVHYKGGCLLNDNLWWGAIMLAFQARPPDPAIVGAGWHALWQERLAAMPFWPKLWLDHQRRDAYWRHGSVCEDWDAIACPVLVVGGWADAYTNAVPRLLANLRCPRLGLIGPWAHIYPQDGVPGPAIDFLGEATRWWSTWLLGRDHGMMREPMLRAFIEDWQSPATTLTRSVGRFVAEERWPSPTIVDRAWFLGAGTLEAEKPEVHSRAVRSPLWTGTGAGEWMGTGVIGDRPADQRADDGQSLCFDSAPLAAALDVLGFPTVDVDLASDYPHAQIAVRLCDVAPDGSSLRVSYGVLNLSHREGSAEPSPMVPGVLTPIRLALDACGHRFPAGHRIRLAVSTAYWPLVWPARDPATIVLTTGRSALRLPVRPVRTDETAIVFAPPRHGPAAPQTRLDEGRAERRATLDLLNGVATYETNGEGGLFGEGVVRSDETGIALSHSLRRTLTIGSADPQSATSRIDERYVMTGLPATVVIDVDVVQSADAHAFRIAGTLQVREDDIVVFERAWDERVGRDGL